MSAETSGARAALRYPDFRRYAFGRFFATMAWQMLGVAVGWQVYAITRDPLDLGLVGLAQFLPFLALVLPGGQVADRADRRLVMVAAYGVEALCAIVLIGFTLSGSREVWPVFLAMALFGAGRAFWMPSGQAMVVNLVPREVFPSAVAFNSTSGVKGGARTYDLVHVWNVRLWRPRPWPKLRFCDVSCAQRNVRSLPCSVLHTDVRASSISG